MKKIAYVIGAGATQAEASYRGGEPVNLLMKSGDLGSGVSERVLKRAKIKEQTLREKLDLTDETDIEKLISLLVGTGLNANIDYASILRKAYYEEIIKSIQKAEVQYEPALAIGLLQMHMNKIFAEHESLLGIISLNHDDLFQVASTKVYSGVNLGFNFKSNYFKFVNTDCPLLIHLHGAFNFRKDKPINVLKLTPKTKYHQNMLWIPPTILKEAKDYPFNKMMGLSYELISKCDVLRIIGCSLSQNDWNLISLIFSAQNNQYFFKSDCFKIELIMDIENFENNFKKQVSYLKNIIPIYQLADGDFDGYKEGDRPKPSALDNPFHYWLKTKVKQHISNGQFDRDSLKEPLSEIIEA